MIVRLRAHHLLCILTYRGKGYSPAFVRTMSRVVARLSRGARVGIVAGPDDICRGLRGGRARHCVRPSARRRDRLAAADLRRAGEAVRCGRSIGRLGNRRLAAWRAGFAAGRTRRACAACPWASLCDATAEAGFAEAFLDRRKRGRVASPTGVEPVSSA